MFAAQAKGFKEALPHGGDGNAELAQTVSDDGAGDRGVRRSPVLDDFESPDARALGALARQVQPTFGCGAQEDRAGRGEVGLGIEIPGDAHRMRKHGPVDVVLRIDVDAPHELDELPRLGQIVTAGLVDRLANEMEGHFL